MAAEKEPDRLDNYAEKNPEEEIQAKLEEEKFQVKCQGEIAQTAQSDSGDA